MDILAISLVAFAVGFFACYFMARGIARPPKEQGTQDISQELADLEESRGYRK